MTGALYGGSTGQTSAERVERTIEAFYRLPLNSQTSAEFANAWTSRLQRQREVRRDYIIGGGEAQSAAGWMAYLQRVLISTANTSTQGRLGTLGLPLIVWTDFVDDHAALKLESTHNSGAGDVAQGQRVYEFTESTAIDSTKWRGGGHREFLSAWGCRRFKRTPNIIMPITQRDSDIMQVESEFKIQEILRAWQRAFLSGRTE